MNFENSWKKSIGIEKQYNSRGIPKIFNYEWLQVRESCLIQPKINPRMNRPNWVQYENI